MKVICSAIVLWFIPMMIVEIRSPEIISAKNMRNAASNAATSQLGVNNLEIKRIAFNLAASDPVAFEMANSEITRLNRYFTFGNERIKRSQ